MAEDLVKLPEVGTCWWCGAPADSREHKYKRSDLVREFGKPPYYGMRGLSRISADARHQAKGPNSPVFQFPACLCSSCNGARSQPFDRAWDLLTSHVAASEADILASQGIDLAAVFGPDWEQLALGVGRYVAKQMICRQVTELPGPLRMDRPIMHFMDGGPWPDSYQLDLCIDLGVVEMLRTTRNAPTDDPEAANAGFLYSGPVHVEVDAQGRWHTPQSSIYYRWIAAFWRIGAGGPRNPFQHQMLRLTSNGRAVRRDVPEDAGHPGGSTPRDLGCPSRRPAPARRCPRCRLSRSGRPARGIERTDRPRT